MFNKFDRIFIEFSLIRYCRIESNRTLVEFDSIRFDRSSNPGSTAMLGRASYSSIYTTVLPPDNISDIDGIDHGVGVGNCNGIRGFTVGVGS
jgi:hypothetical protein